MHPTSWCWIRLRKGKAELGIPSNYFQFYQTSKSLWTTAKRQTGVRSSVSVEFLPLGRSHPEWVRNKDFIDTKESHYLFFWPVSSSPAVLLNNKRKIALKVTSNFLMVSINSKTQCTNSSKLNTYLWCIKWSFG